VAHCPSRGKSPLPLRELVLRGGSGDRHALTEIIRRYQARMARFVITRTGNDSHYEDQFDQFGSLSMIGLESRVHFFVAPLSLCTIRLDTFTGSKSARVRLVMQDRSLSFQRASGVPISPPLSPLSARMMP